MVQQRKKPPNPTDKILNDLAPVKVPKREPLETLIRRFLAREKHDGTDAALSRLAQDFLDWKPDRWDTKIGAAFWPSNVPDQKYQYKNAIDRREIVKGIKRIMARQQEKKRGGPAQRARPAEEDSDSDHDDQLAAPSEATIEPSWPSANRQQSLRSSAGSLEHSELPDILDIMGKPDANFTLSDQDDGPRLVEAPFVTPPATTSRPSSRRQAQPRRSIETGESSRSHPHEAHDPTTPSTWKPHTPTSRSSIALGKRRQRSFTALPVEHPTIPLTPSGVPDQFQIRAWKKGVHHARHILLECGNDFRKKQRTLEKVGLAPEALRYHYQSLGIDEALEKLDESLEEQQRRLDAAAHAHGGDDDISDEDMIQG